MYLVFTRMPAVTVGDSGLNFYVCVFRALFTFDNTHHTHTHARTHACARARSHTHTQKETNKQQEIDWILSETLLTENLGKHCQEWPAGKTEPDRSSFSLKKTANR